MQPANAVVDVAETFVQQIRQFCTLHQTSTEGTPYRHWAARTTLAAGFKRSVVSRVVFFRVMFFRVCFSVFRVFVFRVFRVFSPYL